MLENTNIIRENVSVDAVQTNVSQEGGRRNIEAILARRSRRLQARRETFAPDFLHGAVQLEDIYRVLGFAWVEQAAFVEPIYGSTGEVLAVSVAYFNDYFLTIEQAVAGEVDDLSEWVGERVAERKTCVELVLGERAEREVSEGFCQKFSEVAGVIPIYCSSKRLSEMEIGLLSVTRDGDLGDRENFLYNREAVLQDSRVNLLSLITLSSRLIAE